MVKKKLAVWKFASCDGCQLSILDLEDEIIPLSEEINIAYFPEASSDYQAGPYDISLVEGSITTAHDLQRIEQVRAESEVLVTIGACASAGGIQALRNFANVKEFINLVYAHPEYIKTLDQSSPISNHVKVDFELRGCPVNKAQLLELINSILKGKAPNISPDSVCTECKAKSNVCLLITEKKPCLGPVTHSGCGAICPTFNRPCFGCYGPKPGANTNSLNEAFKAMGLSSQELLRLYRSFNPNAEEFLKEAKKHE